MAEDSDGPEQLRKQVHRLSSIAYDKGLFLSICKWIAHIHRIVSTAPRHKPEATFYQRDPIYQAPHGTRVLKILDDETQRWLNTVASCI